MLKKVYSDYSDNFKLGIVLAWMLSFFVIVLNCSSIVYLSTKKHRFVRQIRMKGQRRRFSVYSKIDTSVYKPDELIVLSLCASNLFVGLAAAIKLMAVITEAEDLWFHKIISYIVTFAMFVSLIHILLLSLERLLAVRSPFCHQELRNKQTLYILMVVWMMSVLPPILNQNASFSLLVAVLMSMSYIILIVTYAYILHAMSIAFKTNTNSIISDNDSNRRQKERERRSTFSCCSIVISYIVCTIFPVVKLIVSETAINSLDTTMDLLMFVFLLMRSLSDPLVYTLRNKIYNVGMYIFQCSCKKSSTDAMEIDDFNLSLSDDEDIYILFVNSRETVL